MSTNLYPFVSKSTIKARLANEPAFRQEAMVLLYQKQTEHEQATKSTLNKNRVGFMSSHAVKGSEVAIKIQNGETLTEEDNVTIDTIAPRYSRQIAGFLREAAIQADPSLAETARMFSCKVPELPAVEQDETDPFAI